MLSQTEAELRHELLPLTLTHGQTCCNHIATDEWYGWRRWRKSCRCRCYAFLLWAMSVFVCISPPILFPFISHVRFFLHKFSLFLSPVFPIQISSDERFVSVCLFRYYHYATVIILLYSCWVGWTVAFHLPLLRELHQRHMASNGVYAVTPHRKEKFPSKQRVGR